MELSPEQIGVYFGIALSLAFAYIPKLQAWYDQKSKSEKALFMLGSVSVVGVGLFLASCAGFSLLGVVCSLAGVGDLLSLLIKIAIANQATYIAGVRPFNK
jgi:hypothetical protein